MSYFEYFPKMSYEFEGNKHTVTDILRRCAFISEYKPYTDLFYSHTIADGETPQSLAQQIYDSVNYYWIILLFNEIHNPYFDWPLIEQNMIAMCTEKYTQEVMLLTRHYEYEGLIVGEVKDFSIPWEPPVDTGLGTSVSFYDYEVALNDAKREIQILRPELLGNFIDQFRKGING